MICGGASQTQVTDEVRDLVNGLKKEIQDKFLFEEEIEYMCLWNGSEERREEGR